MSKEKHKAEAAKDIAEAFKSKTLEEPKQAMKHIMQGAGNVVQYLNGSIKDPAIRKEFEDWLNHQATLASAKLEIELASHTFTLGEFEKDNPANPEEYATIYQLHYSILPPPPKEAFSPDAAKRWSESGLQAVCFLVQNNDGTILQFKESPANAKNEIDATVIDTYPTLH